MGYDLLQAVCCGFTHHRVRHVAGFGVRMLSNRFKVHRQSQDGALTGIGVCMLRDHTSQAVRFDTRIGMCMLRVHTSQGVRFVLAIGVCMLRDHTSQGGYDLLRASACV